MLPGSKGFARDLGSVVPELATLADYRIETPFLLDSSSAAPEHWLELAELISARMRDFDGFVVTHGTDTLAYTAAALSFSPCSRARMPTAAMPSTVISPSVSKPRKSTRNTFTTLRPLARARLAAPK